MLLGCKDLTAKSPSSLSLETPAAARNVDSLFFEPTIYLLCEEKALIPNHELDTSFRNLSEVGADLIILASLVVICCFRVPGLSQQFF